MPKHIARRTFVRTLAAVPALSCWRVRGNQSAQKVLRYAFPVAETGFDPAQLSDLYSRTVTAHIFDSLVIYDYLARPAKIKPLVADGMPDVSSDFRVYTFRVQRGILFHDDPAFKGQPRELTAQDFVYAIKRYYDPRWKSPIVATLEEYQLLGLNELRRACIKNRTPFPYDSEVDGLRALDRYTLRIRLAETAPTFIEVLAEPDLFGAVAREVVEAYGDDIMAHPIGTGPFRLAHWARSSKIILERHPKYRESIFDAEPEADDVPAQAAAQRLRGARLPLLDRVEISIIDEPQPRWL